MAISKTIVQLYNISKLYSANINEIGVLHLSLKLPNNLIYIFSEDFLSFGNKFYDKRSNEPIEQTPVLLTDGVSRSIRIIGEPADNKLMVQIVPTKATFYDDRSLERIIEYSIQGRIDDLYRGNNLKRASDALKGMFQANFCYYIFPLGLCVRTSHLENNRMFPVYRLSSEPARR